MSNTYAQFCKLDELPPGAKKALKIRDTWVLVVNDKGRLLAVSNWCSHQKKPLVNGRVRSCAITCPVHGAKFNLETGEALNLPATKPIPTYEVRVVDDWVEVLI